MSYPQQDADQAVVKGADLFRLNTLLASPGDIYESSQGALAMALGPDSDIAEVNISYYDAQQPLGINNVVLSTTRSMVGKIDVNNTPAAYLPANRPGKILIAPANLWNPDFLPGEFDETHDTQILETPRLDVIQYFHDQPSLVPQRRDKTYTFQSVAVPAFAAARAYVTVPFYGRKYANITVVMPGGNTQGGFITVYGHTLTIGDQSGAGTPVISQILASKDQVAQFPYNYQLNGGATLYVDPTSGPASESVGGGMFDLISVSVTYGTAPAVVDRFFCEITVSDNPSPNAVMYPPPA